MQANKLCAAVTVVALSAVAFGKDALKLPEGDEVFSRVALGDKWVDSKTGLKRTCWDFERAIDLSDGKQVTFEYRYDNPLAVSMLNVYFRTGPADSPTGWYVCNFGPTKPGWNRATFGGDMATANRRNFRVSGKPEGWDKITALRFSVWGPGDVSTRFDIRGYRALAAGESANARERRLMWTLCDGLDGAWDWDRTAAFCRKCRLTDVIARTTQNGSTCYPSAHTPADGKSLAAHGDQIAQALAACRREGLKFHAWIICWQVRGTKAYIAQMRDEGRLQFPEPDGKGDDGWIWPWLCPADPRNIELEANLALELASRGVDGVHLDYIRHNNARLGCFCERCRGKFEARLGRPVANWPKDVKAGGRDIRAWDAFRGDCVTVLVKTIRDRLRATYPKVELSAAVQPYPACQTCAQDWPEWCRAGIVDFVCPMDYHSSPTFLMMDLHRQKPIMRESGVPIYPGIGVAGSGLNLSAWDAARQIDVIRDGGFPGFTFFWLLKGNARVFEQLADRGPLAE